MKNHFIYIIPLSQSTLENQKKHFAVIILLDL